MNEIILIVMAYLLGSIPFGLLLSRLFLKIDVRTIGSGNIGATNVMRTGNKKLALATLMLDAAKAACAVAIAVAFSEDSHMHHLAGATSILGHIFPVWLKFRGGKGVASFLGALLVLKPIPALGLLAIWLIVAKVFRISSLAALVGMLAFVVYVVVMAQPFERNIWLVVVAIMLFRHKDNLLRLVRGQEAALR